MNEDNNIPPQEPADSAPEVPAGMWERTLLTITPFALLGLLFLLDRLVRG